MEGRSYDRNQANAKGTYSGRDLPKEVPYGTEKGEEK
jgi:hypothetical protein